MKLDYYSALDRLFPYWTAASSLQNANLPCRRLVRFWVLWPEDYKEPEEAFKKVSWDEVGFVDYFPNKSTSAQIGYSEWWGSVLQSSHVVFSVTFSPFFVLVLILCFLSVPFFSLFFLFLHYFWKSLFCFLNCIREADSRISVCSPRLHTEKEVDRIIQNSSERLYCSFLWETARNHPSVT